MAREKIRAALRRLEEPGLRDRLRARAAGLARPLRSAEARERLRGAWLATRRRPEAVLAAALVTGVVVMVLHWS